MFSDTVFGTTVFSATVFSATVLGATVFSTIVFGDSVFNTTVFSDVPCFFQTNTTIQSTDKDKLHAYQQSRPSHRKQVRDEECWARHFQRQSRVLDFAARSRLTDQYGDKRVT